MLERLREKRELRVAGLPGGPRRELPDHRCDASREHEESEAGHVRFPIRTSSLTENDWNELN